MGGYIWLFSMIDFRLLIDLLFYLFNIFIFFYYFIYLYAYTVCKLLFLTAVTYNWLTEKLKIYVKKLIYRLTGLKVKKYWVYFYIFYYKKTSRFMFFRKNIINCIWNLVFYNIKKIKIQNQVFNNKSNNFYKKWESSK